MEEMTLAFINGDDDLYVNHRDILQNMIGASTLSQYLVRLTEGDLRIRPLIVGFIEEILNPETSQYSPLWYVPYSKGGFLD